MNKKIKKRKKVLKNVSSLLQNKRKIFLLYLLSMASRHQIQQKRILYLDSRNQIFMADINRYGVEEQLCYWAKEWSVGSLTYICFINRSGPWSISFYKSRFVSYDWWSKVHFPERLMVYIVWATYNIFQANTF